MRGGIGTVQQRPIGWYVKRLDTLLEQFVEHAVGGHGLTRRHWQVLHTLADEPGGRTTAELAGGLDAFDGVDAVVDELVTRGWLEDADRDRLRLTAAGRSVHEELWAEVARLRRRLTDGLSEEECAATVAALARMVENAERALGGAAEPGSR